MKIIEDKNANSLSYYFEGDYLSKDIYNFLKEKLKKTDMVRVSLHSNANELTQSMIIAIKNKFIPFHKNIKKDKIYYVIEGEMNIILKNKKITLKEKEFFKLKKNTFAAIKSISKIVIYNEIVAGPFKKGDSVYE